MNKCYYWFSIFLFVFLSNSYKSQGATLVDVSKDVTDFTKFSPETQKIYKDSQAERLKSWTDESKNCPLTTSYVERLLRRLYVFSELAPHVNSDTLDKERTFTLRMACGEKTDRRMIQQEFGVMNFGTEMLSQLKSEDQLAALLSLELARFMLAYDHKVLDVKDTFFKLGRSQRVIVMKRNMIYDVDSLAARILVNAGYDAFALIEVIDIAEAFYAGRTAPISIAMGKSDKRRLKLQDLMVSERIGPSKQVDGAVPRMKMEIAEVIK